MKVNFILIDVQVRAYGHGYTCSGNNVFRKICMDMARTKMSESDPVNGLSNIKLA